MGGFNNGTRIKNVFNDEKSIYCESDIPAKNLQKWINIVYPMFEAFLIGDYSVEIIEEDLVEYILPKDEENEREII